MRLRHSSLATPHRLAHHAGSRHIQRGQATVEFGLTIVLLLMVVIGILEFGRIVWLYNTLSNLSREIARYTIAIQHQREAT
jgi:Flp pilus assembly protein TadG